MSKKLLLPLFAIALTLPLAGCPETNVVINEEAADTDFKKSSSSAGELVSEVGADPGDREIPGNEEIFTQK